MPLILNWSRYPFMEERRRDILFIFLNQKKKHLSVLRKLQPLFENPATLKIGQNFKYDIQVLANYGIKVKGPLFDTMLAHYLLEPDLRHNMDFLSETYLSYTPVPIESLIGEKGKNQKNMRSVAVDKILEYAVEDADVTWQLKEIFEPMLQKRGAYQELAEKIEMPSGPGTCRYWKEQAFWLMRKTLNRLPDNYVMIL